MNATPTRDAGRKAAKRKPSVRRPRKSGGKPGRPTKYRAEYDELARNYCLLGATNEDMATVFKVAHSTVELWMARHKTFRAAVEEGRRIADQKVADALYHRALGYKHKAVKIALDAKTGESATKEYIEHYPPDTVACIFWLKNRQPRMWRDKIVAEQTGPDDGPIQVTNTVQAAPALAAVLEKMRGARQ